MLKLKSLSVIILLIFVLGCKASQSANNAPTNIDYNLKIASYNIREFGNKTRFFNSNTNITNNSYKIIAHIINKYDIVSIIETVNPVALDNLARELKKISNEEWEYHCSDYALGNSEFYSFIWRKSKVQKLWVKGKYYSENPKLQFPFQRDPYALKFKSNNFDFILIAFHSDPSSGILTDELKLMDEVYTHFSLNNPDEKDIILLGDFNNESKYTYFTDLTKSKTVVPLIKKITMTKSLYCNDNIFYNQYYTKNYKNSDVDYVSSYEPYYNLDLTDHYPVFVEVDTSVDYD